MNRLLLTATFALVACQTPASSEPRVTTGAPAPALPVSANQPVRITIVGTNDTHGWVSLQKETFPRGEIRYGGLSLLGAYLEVLRKENVGGVVLLDAGDLFQGTLTSNLSEGAAVIEGFNVLGYDAAAIGNHEFDYGPVGPISAASQPSMDAFGALKARIAQAKFPLLSTNIYEASDGSRPRWLPGDGTVIIERKGLKIGIIGLTTPQTPTVTLPINVASLRFRPLGPEALAAATRLRERGADLVVATVHAGGRCADISHKEDTSSCDLDTAEVFEMMHTLPEGTLDAVVAGHTHAQIGQIVNGTPIIESFSFGRRFGFIDLYVDPKTKKVLPAQTAVNAAIELCETWDVETRSCDPKVLKARADQVTPVPTRFRGQIIHPVEAVAEALLPSEQATAALQVQPLGLEVPATLGRVYEGESPLGDLLADSLRALSKADVALMNPGGLRADLRQGPLTYGGIYEVIPFDNAVATLDVTGEQLERILTAAFAAKKGVMQVSGVEVKLSHCLVPDRLRGFTLQGGKKWQATRRYKVVMPDFLARGGDGFGPVLSTIDPSQVDLAENRGTNLRDDLIAFWKQKKEPLKAPRTGRVAFVDSKEDCPGPTHNEMP